jgi:hypothetical protein
LLREMNARTLILLGCFAVRFGIAQGTFQNLNFESAVLPVIPAGQLGGRIPIDTGLPGWSGDIAIMANPADILHQSQVRQNGHNLGLPVSPFSALLGFRL